MIPPIIHYCWFGGKEMPEKFIGFIDGWKKKHGEYSFICWNEENAPVHLPYLKTALQHKKWANASNLVRLWALYHQGGIYLDTDVELLQSLDEFRSLTCFLGKEKDRNRIYVNNAIAGAVPKHWFIRECLTHLQLHYDGTEQANLSSPILTTNIIEKYAAVENDEKQIVKDINLFPSFIFHPVAWYENTGKFSPDERQVAIHHYAKTWHAENNAGNWRKWLKKIAANLPVALKNKWKYGSHTAKILSAQTVVYGPFRGIKFARMKAHGSKIYPKIIGSYESCLHHVFYRSTVKNYECILHLGAGEGYYAAGLETLLRPENGSIAYECDERNVALLKENLDSNMLSARVKVIAEKATCSNVVTWIHDKVSLVVCDIEGDEASVFKAENVESFKKSDLIIELHEFIHGDIATYLCSLFHTSHDAELIEQEMIPEAIKKLLTRDMRSGNLLQLTDEGRPEKMRWLILWSKTS